MCTLKHRPPCWRDPQWDGPVPLRVWNDQVAMTAINKDRADNAKRLGESCKQLKPPSAEDVNMLDETYEQWPFPTECPTCTDDVSKEADGTTAVDATTIPTTIKIQGAAGGKDEQAATA